MLPDSQQERLRCYMKALEEWEPTGFITFRPRVEEWLANELQMSLREIRRHLYDHVKTGGQVQEVPEKNRPEFAHWEFHYDLRVKIGARRIYFETVLDADDPDDPTIIVVSAHDV